MKMLKKALAVMLSCALALCFLAACTSSNNTSTSKSAEEKAQVESVNSLREANGQAALEDNSLLDSWAAEYLEISLKGYQEYDEEVANSDTELTENELEELYMEIMEKYASEYNAVNAKYDGKEINGVTIDVNNYQGNVYFFSSRVSGDEYDFTSNSKFIKKSTSYIGNAIKTQDGYTCFEIIAM